MDLRRIAALFALPAAHLALPNSGPPGNPGPALTAFVWPLFKGIHIFVLLQFSAAIPSPALPLTLDFRLLTLDLQFRPRLTVNLNRFDWTPATDARSPPAFQLPPGVLDTPNCAKMADRQST